MNFLIFLWNIFARIVGFIVFISFEIFIFSIIIKVLNESGLPAIANILTFVFVIWIIIDIILKIFVGGAKSLIRTILRY